MNYKKSSESEKNESKVEIFNCNFWALKRLQRKNLKAQSIRKHLQAFWRVKSTV